MYAVKQTLEKNMALLTEGGPHRLGFYKPGPPDGGPTPLRLDVKMVPGLRLAIRSFWERRSNQGGNLDDRLSAIADSRIAESQAWHHRRRHA